MMGRWCLRNWVVTLCVVVGLPAVAMAGPATGSIAAEPKLAVPASIAAWGGISSWNALFDVVAVVGSQLDLSLSQQGPPGPALWGKAEGVAKGLGISTLSWMRRDQPLRFFLQDEGGEPGIGNLVVLLPMTDQAAVLAALPGAQVGAEGHAALFSIGNGQMNVYVDFLPAQVALTFETGRWQRVSAIASGPLATAPPPGVFSLGLSMTNLLALRSKEVQKLKDLLDNPSKLPAQVQAGASSYTAAIKQMIDELDTFEVVLGGNKDSLQMAFRVRGRDGSALAKSLHAGDGRSAEEMAKFLPGASYFAVAGHADPAPAIAEAREKFAVLQAALEIPKKLRPALLAQYTALLKGLTGDVAMALYPDSGSALGSLLVLGAKDPKEFRQTTAQFAGQIALLLMDKKERGTAVKGKQPRPKGPKQPADGLTEEQLTVIARKSLARGTLEPFIAALAPKAEQAGLRISQTQTSADGMTCDAIEIGFDWAKLGKGSEGSVSMAVALLGKGLTLAACTTPRFVIFASGATAMAQARRVANNEAGGLTAQPSYRAAVARAVANPSSLILFDAVGALQTFQAALESAALKARWAEALGAALPMSVSTGTVASATEYRIDLPLSFLAAMKKAFKLVAEGDAAADAAVEQALEAPPEAQGAP